MWDGWMDDSRWILRVGLLVSCLIRKDGGVRWSEMEDCVCLAHLTVRRVRVFRVVAVLA